MKLVWHELDSIPDVLNQHGLLAEEPVARLAEHWQAWSRAISSFAAWREDWSLCLRFISDAQHRRIRFFVGVSLADSNGDDTQKHDDQLQMLFERLAVLGIKLVGSDNASCLGKRLDPDVPHDAERISDLFPDLREKDAIVHVTQWMGHHDWEIARTETQLSEKQRRWSFRPHASPKGSNINFLRSLFERSLTIGEGYISISFYIKPATPRIDELQWLWNQMSLVGKHASKTINVDNEEQRNVTDHILAAEARLYQEYLTRLEPAFITVAEVVVKSESKEQALSQANSLARILASELEDNQCPLSQQGADSHQLPGRCTIMEPGAAFEAKAGAAAKARRKSMPSLANRIR